MCGWFRKIQLRLYKRSIDDALALHRRNEVRSDGLVLDSICSRLEISWYARDVHPWDFGLSPEQREAAFNQQAMEDTEAAVRRLLERRPEVEIIEIRVREPHSGALLAAGTVERSALNTADVRSPSARMRLGELGIKYVSLTEQELCRTGPRGEFSRKIDDRRIA